MSLVGPKSQSMQKRAEKVLPLGVNSNFRYWGEGLTPYVDKAKGAYLWDLDGRRFIDYRMAFGPIILGHAYDEVDAKVIEEVKNGVLFAMTGELEVEVAGDDRGNVPGCGHGSLCLFRHGSDDARHPCGTRIHRTRNHFKV